MDDENDNKKENNYNNIQNLILTPETNKQLELLAIAMQSKRAVLLEGDTCSRKTSLVRELARLTNNKLIIIPMHQDIETSDLIGQWIPINSSNEKEIDDLYSQFQKIFNNTLKFIMVFIITRLKYEAMNQLIGKIEVICERNFEIKNCINENQSEQFSNLILD